MLLSLLQALSKEKDPLRLGRLHYEMARLFESPLSDAASALEHYQKAYALCPDHLPTLRGTRRALLGKKSFHAALPLFDAEIRFTGDSALKALLHYEKGRVVEDSLGQKREARDAYASALELDPGNAVYLKALERVDIAQKSWDALDKTYQSAANAVAKDGRHRAALLALRARLMEARKADGRAATELYGEAIGFDDRAAGVLEALKRLHYAQGRWRDLCDVLSRESEQASEPQVRAMAQYRKGRVLIDRLGHFDEGLAAFERAAAEVPDDPMVLEELGRLYEQGKKWDALADVLERLAQGARSTAEKLALYLRIGQIAEERLGDDVRAIGWFSRALEVDPAFVPGLQALGKMLTREGQWDALIAMHLAEAGATPDATRRAAAHARVAGIYEQHLENPDASAHHHARALGFCPGYATSFKALSRIFQQSGKWRELIELYERAVDEAKDPETKMTFLFKIGRTYEDSLGSAQHALGAYKRVLEVAPGHAGGLHAVQRAAERAGRHQDLVWALEAEAETFADKKQAVMLIHRAGEVLEEQLGDVEAALARYRRVSDIERRYLPALTSLGRLYHEAARWEDLLETYKQELEATPKGTQSAAILFKMGELTEERIGRDEDAMSFYRRAIDADPFHVPALHALRRKLAERGQWVDLVKLIELELTGLKDPAERARAAFHAGEVYENRMSQPEKALAAYEQALGAAPDFRPALDGRTRLLTQAREMKRLVEELGREAGAAVDQQLAVAALYRQGEIARDELGDTRRAIEAFEAVLERDSAHLGALLALEPLYSDAGSWEALARVYATEARVLGDPGARVAALRELARLEETRGVGKSDDIKGAYIAVLQLASSDPGALGMLERIAIDTRDQQLLTHVDAKLGTTLPVPALAAAHQTRFAETLEQMGDPGALETFRAALGRDPENMAAAHGIARLAEKSDDPALLAEAADATFRVLDDRAASAGLMVKAALARMARGDADGAAGMLEAALERDPESPEAAAELKRFLLSRREVDRLFDALCQAAQWSRNRERIAALWMDVSEILADEKRDVAAALAALHRTLDAVPGHVPTLMRLAQLYARDQQWAEAVDRLKQVLTSKPGAEVEIAAHLMLAEILKTELGDEARALMSLERVLELDPRNRDALGRLCEIQARRGQFAKAAETAATLVAVASSNKERAEALCSLGRLERLSKQHDAAAHAYEQAVSLVGLEGTAAGEFKELLIEQKQLRQETRWDYYVGALGAYAEKSSDPSARSTIYLEIARVLGDELGMSDRCLHTLQRAVAADPERIDLRTELAVRLRDAGHFPQALVELRRLLDVEIHNADTWRSIVFCLQAMQRKDEAALCMAPLCALGLGNDLEQATISSRPSRTAHARPGSFDEAAFRAVDAKVAGDPALAVLAAVSEGLGKVHAPELERYGLVSRDRITSRSGHPLKVLADRVASVFGPLEFDLYLHRAHQGGLEIEFTDPPGILVPAHVAGLREQEQVFLFARPLALLARGAQAVARLAPAEIALLLISAARLLEPSFGAGFADEDFLTQQSKRVQKSLSRARRRMLEEVAPSYMARAQIDFEQWAFETRRMAARAAVVLADELPGTITLVRRTEGDLAGLRGAALQQGTALVNDLLRFWVSDGAFALRRRLGLIWEQG